MYEKSTLIACKYLGTADDNQRPHYLPAPKALNLNQASR